MKSLSKVVKIFRFVNAQFRAFPDWHLERRNTYDFGDTVRIIEWTGTGTHQGEFTGIPPTHRSIEMLGCSIFTLGADGFIGEEVAYTDAATVLRQLGVLPNSADA